MQLLLISGGMTVNFGIGQTKQDALLATSENDQNEIREEIDHFTFLTDKVLEVYYSPFRIF